MTELDVSNHTLNTSTSKQKFSFPKTDRFKNQATILYSFIIKDARIYMKYQVPKVVVRLPSDMAIKIWELDRISSYHPWGLIH